MSARARCTGWAVLMLVLAAGTAVASVDVGYQGWGLSLGNSARAHGLRINAVDRDVERVDGLNLTLWNPEPSPRATFNGVALGLIGPKAGSVHGIAVGGLGATARKRVWGVVAGGFGAGTTRLRGLAAGGLLVDVQGSGIGAAVSGLRTRVPGSMLGLTAGLAGTDGGRFDGLALGGLWAFADTIRGLSVGGVLSGGVQVDGLVFSGGGAFAEVRGRGLFVGGVMAGAGTQLTGVAVSPGVAGAGGRVRGVALAGLGAGAGRSLEGIAIALGGVGAIDRIRGLAVGGLTVLSPDIEGVAAGALNGVMVEEVNLEDFLKIRTVNERFVGLSVGLVNTTRELKGVQLGLFNYAANNPRWLRLLPLVNVHF